MATRILQDVRLLIEEGELHSVSNQASLELTADAPETTVFGAEWRTFDESILRDADFACSGFMPTAATDDNLDWAYDVARGEETWDTPRLAIFPGKQAAVGDVVYLLNPVGTSFQVGQSYGELTTYAFACKARGEIYRGQIAYQLRRTATAVGYVNAPPATFTKPGSSDRYPFAWVLATLRGADDLSGLTNAEKAYAFGNVQPGQGADSTFLPGAAVLSVKKHAITPTGNIRFYILGSYPTLAADAVVDLSVVPANR